MTSKNGHPTASNKTGRATAADSVMTPKNIARTVIEEFVPQGLILEPCKGTGNIYDLLPEPKDWCEITQGRDFLSYQGKVDWIITNPPYSIYDLFLKKCFEVADNVVLICPIAKAFKSLAIERMVDDYGGLRMIWLMGGGQDLGFAFGFPAGCLYYQRGYQGPIMRKVTYHMRKGEAMKCPKCGSEPFWRRFNTPVNGIIKTTLITGCSKCHTATIVEEKVKT